MKLEYKTTHTDNSYDVGKWDDDPAPVIPSGDGWRLCQAFTRNTNKCAVFYWVWERRFTDDGAVLT